MPKVKGTPGKTVARISSNKANEKAIEMSADNSPAVAATAEEETAKKQPAKMGRKKKTEPETVVQTPETKPVELESVMNPPEGEAKVEDNPAAVEPAVAKAPAKRGRKKATTVVDAPVDTKAPAKRGRKKAAPVAETTVPESPEAAAVAPADALATEEKVTVQFSGKSYSTEDLVKIAKDIWVYDLGKDEADFKSVELYVKTEESTVYYVINGEVQGSFNI